MLTDILRMVFCLPTGILYVIFLYFMFVILKVFFKFPHLQENSRYVLFIHMLVNDSLFILTSFTIYVHKMFSILWPLMLCFLIISLNTCAFRVTPYNLAVMALERYAAICHPLRHAELCNVQRSKVAILVMWIVSFLPQFFSFLTFSYFANKGAFSANVICHWPLFTIHEAQETIRTSANAISFGGVWLIIAYTYVRVIMVARKAGSGKIASKAGKTVLLHIFQLLLCTMSFLSGFADRYFAQYFLYLQLVNFIMLMCLPRLLSPFVYGIRDEIFSKHMTKMCRSVKTSSP